MSLNLSGSKSKTTSNSTSNSRSVTTPNAPEWASTLAQNIAGRVGGLVDADPYRSVAPAHGLQVQAADRAGRLGGLRSAPQVDAVTVGRGESLLDNLGDYMSPYTRDVVDSALADYDFSAGQTRAQQDLDLAGSGAFGGSGSAITRSMTEDALVRGRAATSAKLRDDAFMRGAALSSEDANRRQQALGSNAQFAHDRMSRNADLALGFDANERANIAAQAEIGNTLQGLDQRYRDAPATSAQQLVAMLSGLPIGLFTGQTVEGSETTAGSQKTKGVQIGASFDFIKPGGS